MKDLSLGLFIRSIIQKILPKGKFARSATILSGGTMIGQGLVIIAAPLLTRLYDPSDFGALAIFVSILSILVVVVSLKYHLAIPLPPEDNMAVNLVTIAMAIVVGMTILTSICLFLFGDKIIRLLNMPTLKPYMWIIPLSLFGAGIFQVLNYWAIRKENFETIARTQISQGVGMVVTQLTAGLITHGPIGLLLGNAVGWSSGSGTFATLFWKKYRKLLKEITVERMKILAVSYNKFPLISSLSGIINSSGLEVLPMMLASLYGATTVGLFALTQRIIGIPLKFVGSSVTQVYTSEAARLVISNPCGLETHFLKQAKMLLLIGSIPILIIGQICPFIFGFIFGHAWSEAGRYAQILSITFAINFVVLPLSSTLNVLERQGTQFLWDTGRLFLIVITILICSKLKYSAFTMIAAYAFSMSCAYIVLFLLSYQAVKQKCRNA